MLKPLVYSVLIAVLFSACSFSRQASQTDSHITDNNRPKQAIQFIEHIAVDPSITLTSRSLPSTHSLKELKQVSVNPFNAGLYILNSIEKSSWLQFKYSIMMQVAVEELQNLQLLQFIDEWYATRYRFGGSTKKGIDCSAFTSGLENAVFNITLPRTCRDQYHATERIKRSDLQEGDLVFFSIKKGISHVGVYITNNKFVHASSSNGVMISDLHEAYFSKRFVGAGRGIRETNVGTTMR